MQINREASNNKFEKIDQINIRILKALIMLCDSLGIPIAYCDELSDGDEAQLIYYKFEGVNEFDLDDAYINMKKSNSHKGHYLAHELGHYMAIKKFKDNSEEAADREGRKLCMLILNDEEQEEMGLLLNWYFHKGVESLFDENDSKEKLQSFVNYLKEREVTQWEHFSSLLGA